MAKYRNGVSTIVITKRVSVVINHRQRMISKLKDGKVIENFRYDETYTTQQLGQLLKSVERDAKELI